MFMLMFRCPQTGQTVSTGIYTDPESFRRIPEALGLAYCPCCWLHHRWWPDDAWLADRPPAGPARSIDRAPKQLRAEARPMVSSLNLVKRVRHPCASECLRKSFRSVTGERSPPLDNLAKAPHDPPIRTAQRSDGCVRHALSRRHLCFRFLACPGVLSRADRRDGRHAGVAPGQSSAKRLTARSSSRRIERDPIARFILFVGSRYCTVGPGNFGEGSERA